ncbi:MAG: methyltransferase domain-containing protein [Bdellovibrionales bacterium]|nr:methyltransferase domain-containing protein [Bdellovibrionales bacterium]
MAATALLLSLAGCQCSPSESDTASKGTNAFQRVTGDDVESDRSQWDQVYAQDAYVYGKEPAEVLVENIDILPVGRALDIAMGEGRNAVFLAKKGFVVDGVDLSEVAIRKAKRLAKEAKVEIATINADLNTYQIKPETYEVILNIQYLQRSLIPQIKRGLKRGGVVVFENQTVDQLKLPNSQGIRRDYLLNVGELKELFKDFKILHYSEKNDGKQAVARLVAMKP